MLVPYKANKNSTTDSEMRFKTWFSDKFTEEYGTKNTLQLRKIKMNEDSKDHNNKVQLLSIGTPSTFLPTKVILLVGATGSGKTTLINAMANFIFKVDFQDDFRLILIDDENAPERDQSESQTELITAYTFNHMPGMPFDYNYVLIDTPGFGDTRGLDWDQKLMDQVELFLKKDDYGIDHVDCIGFVIAASDGKLTPNQSYILNGLSSMFANDIKDNISIMVTFADDQEPPVLSALKKADVPYKGYYKFNNSSVYAIPAGPVTKFFWDYGHTSLNDFFLKLRVSHSVSLNLTKEVLEERRHLQEIVVGIQKKIQVGLTKIDVLNQEKAMSSKIDADMKGCENYEEEITVPEIIKINLDPTVCVTNCIKCNLSCHTPCSLGKTVEKKGCIVMKNEICEICPGRCSWKFHHDMNFKFVTKFVKKKVTIQELLDRYNVAKNDSKAKESIIKGIVDDIARFGKIILHDIMKARGHIMRLEEIALKRNPMSTGEYIELMIKSEKMEKKENYLTRIEMLQSFKKCDAILTRIRGMEDIDMDYENEQCFIDLIENLSSPPKGAYSMKKRVVEKIRKVTDKCLVRRRDF